MAQRITPISKVERHWVGGDITTDFVPENEVDRFVTACIRLHHTPGINPHTGGQARKIWKIVAHDMEVRGPFWWSTPDLQENYDPNGARIVDWTCSRELFVDKQSADYQEMLKNELQADLEEQERLDLERGDEVA